MQMVNYNRKVAEQNSLRDEVILQYKDNLIEFIKEFSAYDNINISDVKTDGDIDPKMMPDHVVPLIYIGLRFAARIDENGLLLEPQCHHCDCDGQSCDYHECISVNPLFGDFGH
jgi:hypothetical protein